MSRKEKMTKTILTGVDDSETAFKAAEKAATLANAFGSELHVISAFSVSTVNTLRSLQKTHEREHIHTAYREVTDQHAEQAEGVATAVADKLRSRFPELTIISKSQEGDPGEVLVREGEKLGADVIVVGNKRVQGPARILGSIARTVATETSCDLYVVHTQ